MPRSKVLSGGKVVQMARYNVETKGRSRYGPGATKLARAAGVTDTRDVTAITLTHCWNAADLGAYTSKSTH